MKKNKARKNNSKINKTKQTTNTISIDNELYDEVITSTSNDNPDYGGEFENSIHFDIINSIDVKGEVLNLEEIERRITMRVNEDYLSKISYLDNQLKQVTKNSLEERKFALQNFLEKFIEQFSMMRKITDSALNVDKESGSSLSQWAIAYSGVMDEIEKIMFENGVEKIEPEVMSNFDPTNHCIHNDTEKADGLIESVEEIGYKLNGRVIKFANVVVKEEDKTHKKD